MKASRHMKLTALALTAILATTACATSAPAPATGAAATGGATAAAATAAPAGPSGTVKFGVTEMPASMDPNAAFNTTWQWAYTAFADALTFVTEKGEIQPALALQWQSVSPTEWEFKLRSGVKFQNGDALTAKDVKYTYDRVLNPDKKLLVNTRIPTLQSVRVVDDLTVRFTTKAPDPIWPGRTFAVKIVPADQVTRLGDAEFAKAPVGTGAFKVREFVPGQRVIFDAWEGSWRGVPKVKTVEGYLVADPATLVNGLKSGQFNVIKDPPLDQIESLKSQGFTIDSVAAWRVYLLEFNQSPLFADSRVRQAMNYAVDMKTIASRVFFGYAKPAPAQMAGAGTFGHSTTATAFPFDPAKARSLLDEAGWKLDPATRVRVKDGKPFEITAEYGAGDVFNVGEGAETQAVQQFLADVGIKVKLLASERGAMLPRLTANQPRNELTHGGWAALPIPDADFVYSNFSCKERTDRYPVCDPANAEFEQLYATQKTQVDPAQRQRTWDRIAQLVRDRPIGIYMVQPNRTWVSRGISGFTPRADEITLFDALVVGR